MQEKKTIIPITKDMLGPYVGISEKNTMSLDLMSEYIDKCVTSENDKLPFSVGDFYDISHFYSYVVPSMCQPNQIMKQGVFRLDDSYTMKSEHWSVLTRKYQDNVVGFIRQKQNEFEIDFGKDGVMIVYRNIPNARKYIYDHSEKTMDPDGKSRYSHCRITQSEIPFKDYYDDAYLIKLPFDSSSINNKMNEYKTMFGKSRYCMCKDGKLYIDLNPESLSEETFKETPLGKVNYIRIVM